MEAMIRMKQAMMNIKLIVSQIIAIRVNRSCEIGFTTKKYTKNLSQHTHNTVIMK
jgi:hypothetical protein